MKKDEKKIYPLPSIRRLPLYLNYLRKIHEENISGTVIAEALDILPIQVRKDLAITNVTGKPKVGFNVKELKKAIEHCLGWNNLNDAFLIGAGHFGQALLGYKKFRDHGLNIVAVFDKDEDKVGTDIFGYKIFPVEKLNNLIQRMKVKIGIITTPGSTAQELADTMIEAGVLGIWNFTPATLNVPENIVVENVRLVSSLSVLTSKLKQQI